MKGVAMSASQKLRVTRSSGQTQIQRGPAKWSSNLHIPVLGEQADLEAVILHPLAAIRHRQRPPGLCE